MATNSLSIGTYIPWKTQFSFSSKSKGFGVLNKPRKVSFSVRSWVLPLPLTYPTIFKIFIVSCAETGAVDYASLSNEEWKKKLTPEQFCITRQKGTERAFTGEYWNTTTPGTYHCICCDMPLFESWTKYDSGTGWPSYFQPIGNNVKLELDKSKASRPRQEVLCAGCNAHLGHVFDDGPLPTGKRYCINSAALELKPK